MAARFGAIIVVGRTLLPQQHEKAASLAAAGCFITATGTATGVSRMSRRPGGPVTGSWKYRRYWALVIANRLYGTYGLTSTAFSASSLVLPYALIGTHGSSSCQLAWLPSYTCAKSRVWTSSRRTAAVQHTASVSVHGVCAGEQPAQPAVDTARLCVQDMTKAQLRTLAAVVHLRMEPNSVPRPALHRCIRTTCSRTTYRRGRRCSAMHLRGHKSIM